MTSFANVKGLFFDRALVTRAVDDATRRVLSKFGAFVRTRARGIIRSRKGPSKPGEPPHSHVGLLRAFIFFAYEPSQRSVVIGPTPIGRRVNLDGGMNFSQTTVPELLEYGGEAGVVEDAYQTPDGRLAWARRDMRRSGSKLLLWMLRDRMAKGVALPGPADTVVVPCGRHRFRSYRLAPRPYMRPSFERVKTTKLPGLWADSVKA